MTNLEIRTVQEALIDAKEQIEYLRRELTPRKRSRTEHTTNKCLGRIGKASDVVKEQLEKEQYEQRMQNMQD